MIRKTLLSICIIALAQSGFSIDEKIAINTLTKKSERVIDSLKLVVGELIKKGDMSPQARRKASNDFFKEQSGAKEDVKNVRDYKVPSFDGHQISVRNYIPFTSKKDFIILYVHGGGWMQGDLETHDYLCRKISNSWEAEVFAVEYRLAPEHKYPVPLNDVFSVYQWCVKNFPEKQIVLAGDSAGGNLCAALCVKIAKEKYIKPHAQVLFYPVLSSDFVSPSFEKYGELATLTRASTILFISQYAGKPHDDPSIVSNHYIYPLSYQDMNAFPKTFLVPASCDVLLDGQEKFEKRLKESEIPVHLIHTIGTVHGFMTYGREFNEEISYVLERVNSVL